METIAVRPGSATELAGMIGALVAEVGALVAKAMAFPGTEGLGAEIALAADSVMAAAAALRARDMDFLALEVAEHAGYQRRCAEGKAGEPGRPRRRPGQPRHLHAAS